MRHPNRSSHARRPRLARRTRGGAAAAEFALTLPVILFMLLATIEYGNYFSQLAIVNSVTRDAARFASNQGSSTDAQTVAGTAFMTLAGDIGYNCDGGLGCGVNPLAYQENGRTYIELQVRIPYDQLTNAIPQWGMGIDSLALPTQLRARAVYPLVGP